MAGDSWICLHSMKSREIILSAIHGVQFDDNTFMFNTAHNLRGTLLFACV